MTKDEFTIGLLKKVDKAIEKWSEDDNTSYELDFAMGDIVKYLSDYQAGIVFGTNVTQ